LTNYVKNREANRVAIREGIREANAKERKGKERKKRKEIKESIVCVFTHLNSVSKNIHF
jgi:hypothetical protein